MGKEVRKENDGRGGDRKKMIGENEMLMLPVCPPFVGGSTVSGLNIIPEIEKEVGG